MLDKLEIEESEKESEIDNEDNVINQIIQEKDQKAEDKPNKFVLSTEWSIKDCLNLIEGKINYVK